MANSATVARWTFDDAPAGTAAASRTSGTTPPIVRFEDVTTDAGALLSFASYKDLARDETSGAPFRGSKCLKLKPGTSTAEANLEDTGAFDTALADVIDVGFQVYISPTVGQGWADGDRISIFQLRSSGSTSETAVMIEQLGDATNQQMAISIAETHVAAAAGNAIEITPGTWNSVEIQTLCNAGAGTIDGFVNHDVAFTGLTSLTTAAVVDAALGQVARTGAVDDGGFILIDQFVVEAATAAAFNRQFIPQCRFPDVMNLDTSQHLFVGPGWLDDATLISGTSVDTTIKFYDLDVEGVTLATTPPTLNPGDVKATLVNTAANETVNLSQPPLYFKDGCYVEFSNVTTPDAIGPFVQAKVDRARSNGGDGTMRHMGRQRA